MHRWRTTRRLPTMGSLCCQRSSTLRTGFPPSMTKTSLRWDYPLKDEISHQQCKEHKKHKIADWATHQLRRGRENFIIPTKYLFLSLKVSLNKVTWNQLTSFMFFSLEASVSIETFDETQKDDTKRNNHIRSEFKMISAVFRRALSKNGGLYRLIKNFGNCTQRTIYWNWFEICILFWFKFPGSNVSSRVAWN